MDTRNLNALQPGVSSGNHAGHSSLAILYPTLWSLILCMQILLFSKYSSTARLLISGTLLLYSFLSPKLCLIISNHICLLIFIVFFLPKLQFSKTGDLSLIYPSLLCGLECAFSQKDRAILGVTSFVSLLYGTMLLYSLLSNVYKLFFLSYILTSMVFTAGI